MQDRRFGSSAHLLAALLAVAVCAAVWSAYPPFARATEQATVPLHYLVGLDPDGDNWLALRSEPSGRSGRRLARLDPRTLLVPTGRSSGRWMEAEVVTTEHAGLRGWVLDRYVRCCLYASAGDAFHFVSPGSSLSLRDRPNFAARRIAVMNGGTLLTPLGAAVAADGRTWLPVEVVSTDRRGARGWASTRYVECCVHPIGLPGRQASSPRSTAATSPPSVLATPVIAGAGTGFFVGSNGEILTNAHVVDACVTLEIAGYGEATLLGADSFNDLAVLRVATATADRRLTLRDLGPRLGDELLVVGYPLGSMLGNALSVTTGNLAALSGVGGDARHLQMTAPVQPGNSGGPLLDRAGNVIAVVVARLDDEATLAAAGSLPQNVNFAIKVPVVRAFLEARGINHTLDRTPTIVERSVADVVESVRASVVQVVCLR